MEQPAQPDHYGSLEIEPESTVREVKKAFNRLAKLHHPDKQAPGISVDAGRFREASIPFIPSQHLEFESRES